MVLTYPAFLFALSALAIPVIIHLYNLRRFKKVYFSDVRFLRQVEQQTRSRNNLRHLLILLSRLAAVAALVMAFAQPVIPTAGSRDSQAGTRATVYLDNSFSMSAEGERGRLLSEGSALAIEVANAYANTGATALITNDFDPAHQRIVGLEDFKNEAISALPSPSVRSWGEVISRATANDLPGIPHDIYLITDLQRSSARFGQSPPDSNVRVFVLPVRPQVMSNLFVDSVWFPSPVRLPGQPDVLVARIRNTSDRTMESYTVKLTVNGVQKAIGTADVQARSYEDVELAFTHTTTGIHLAEVSIEDYPVTYDNTFHVSFTVADSVPVLQIRGEDAGNAIGSLFKGDGFVGLSSASTGAIDYSTFSKSSLIVLDGLQRFPSGLVQELARYAEAGGHVLLLPSAKADLAGQNELLLALGAEPFAPLDSSALKVGDVNLRSTLMRNVFLTWGERIDLPTVSGRFPTVQSTKSGREPLLTLSDGSPLMSRYTKGRGSVYVITAPLHSRYTNFHRHALFVPSIYNIALHSASARSSAETIGSGQPIAVGGKVAKTEGLTVQHIASGERFVPEAMPGADGLRIMVHGQVRQDGHWLLLSGTDTIQPLSFNFDRRESALEYMNEKEVRKLAEEAGIPSIEFVQPSVEGLSESIRELHEGKRLWKLFLLLALLFLAIETAIVRLLP